MAGGSLGGRGKRNINNLNLVPFVDLFSTLIIFLISTAVFDDIAAMKTSLGAEDKASVEVPPQEVKKIESSVSVTITDAAYEIFSEGKRSRIAKNGDAFDWKNLEEFYLQVRGQFPDKKDMLIFSTDQALYEDLISVMDRAKAQGFMQLIVTGKEARL
jgi:biopolymer transport protein ExbD